MLNTREALASLMGSTQVKLGLNLSVAMGPVGRQVEGTGVAGGKGSAACYAYAVSRGAFAGVALDGTVRRSSRPRSRSRRRRRSSSSSSISRSSGSSSSSSSRCVLSMARCAAHTLPLLTPPAAATLLAPPPPPTPTRSTYLYVSSPGALHARPAQPQLLRPPGLGHAAPLGQDPAAARRRAPLPRAPLRAGRRAERLLRHAPAAAAPCIPPLLLPMRSVAESELSTLQRTSSRARVDQSSRWMANKRYRRASCVFVRLEMFLDLRVFRLFRRKWFIRE